MRGDWLKGARQQRGWTQQEAAARLGVSQTYLSLLENDRRTVSPRLVRKLKRQFDMPPTHLPVDFQPMASEAQALADALGALGYPGFAHFTRGTQVNPAQLLLAALRMSNLETRLGEALPWVVWQFPDSDWAWLLPQLKLHDLQNRCGFIVALAREVAERQGPETTASTLATVEHQLERSRLVREDTLGRESMTEAERRWLRRTRPPLARHWNLLTSLSADHPSYAA